MTTVSYQAKRGQLETYFDRTAVDAWARLTLDDTEVSRIRATVRAGRNRMRRTLLDWLPEDLQGQRILDAGCGTGATAVELARRGADVVAVDLSPKLIELAGQFDQLWREIYGHHVGAAPGQLYCSCAGAAARVQDSLTLKIFRQPVEQRPAHPVAAGTNRGSNPADFGIVQSQTCPGVDRCAVEIGLQLPALGLIRDGGHELNRIPIGRKSADPSLVWPSSDQRHPTAPAPWLDTHRARCPDPGWHPFRTTSICASGSGG